MTASPIFATTAARPVPPGNCEACADFDPVFGRTGVCRSDASRLSGWCVGPKHGCADLRPGEPKQRGKK